MCILECCQLRGWICLSCFLICERSAKTSLFRLILHTVLYYTQFIWQNIFLILHTVYLAKYICIQQISIGTSSGLYVCATVYCLIIKVCIVYTIFIHTTNKYRHLIWFICMCHSLLPNNKSISHTVSLQAMKLHTKSLQAMKLTGTFCHKWSDTKSLW